MTFTQPMRSTCVSCGARIRWALTAAKHKPIPLNAEPNPKGNVVLISDDSLFVPGPSPMIAHVVQPDDERTPRYMPHHATCPDGTRWKRKP